MGLDKDDTQPSQMNNNTPKIRLPNNSMELGIFYAKNILNGIAEESMKIEETKNKYPSNSNQIRRKRPGSDLMHNQLKKSKQVNLLRVLN